MGVRVGMLMDRKGVSGSFRTVLQESTASAHSFFTHLPSQLWDGNFGRRVSAHADERP